jgi:hypothetical protein
LEQDILGYPYSTYNLHPLSYVSQHELKARANSLAYARYKLIKREAARKAAKRKRLFIMAVVKCRAFATKLKERVKKARERRALEENARIELEMRNRKRIDYAKNLEKLTREDPSLSDSQLSIHNPNNMNLA